MLLADRDIIQRQRECTIIDPFISWKVSEGVVSYGLSHAGYDLRLSNKFKVMTRWTVFKARLRALLRGEKLILDPKKVDLKLFKDVQADYVDIPPGGFVLGTAVEWIGIPEDCLTINIGKSTYARNALIANVTPTEPGWRGHLTLELTNMNPFLPIRVYANEGIIQIIFISAAQNVETPYSDSSRYQDQPAVPVLGTVQR